MGSAETAAVSESSYDWELWLLVCLVAICSIALWEGLKWVIRLLVQGVGWWLRERSGREEPEAEADSADGLFEEQPDQEDDLWEQDPLPPPLPLQLPEPLHDHAQRARDLELVRLLEAEALVPAQDFRVAVREGPARFLQAHEAPGPQMYVDDPLPEPHHEDQGLRWRGQGLYTEEPEREAPPSPPPFNQAHKGQNQAQGRARPKGTHT